MQFAHDHTPANVPYADDFLCGVRAESVAAPTASELRSNGAVGGTPGVSPYVYTGAPGASPAGPSSAMASPSSHPAADSISRPASTANVQVSVCSPPAHWQDTRAGRLQDLASWLHMVFCTSYMENERFVSKAPAHLSHHKS